MSDNKPDNKPDNKHDIEQPSQNDDARERDALDNDPAVAPVGEGPGVTGPSSSLESQLAAARAEAAELKDQLLRALAETENVRRRAQRDREDAQKFAVTGFARDLLPVADNLRRALEAVAPEAIATDEALKNLVTGVEMTERQLIAGFEKHGLKRIDAMGQRFDSNLHQAMFEVPGTDQPAGTVVQVLQAGYTLNDRLLRPAMVGVAKGEPKPAENGGTGGSRVDTTV
jgi:molecular chaperone GrpE